MELAFRTFVRHDCLDVVAFPAEGGSAVLKEQWPLNVLGLRTYANPPHRTKLPFEQFQGNSDFELRVHIDYEGERVSLTPVTPHGSQLDGKTVVYTFDMLGLLKDRTMEVAKAIDERTLTVSADAKPLSDETWP